MRLRDPSNLQLAAAKSSTSRRFGPSVCSGGPGDLTAGQQQTFVSIHQATPSSTLIGLQAQPEPSPASLLRISEGSKKTHRISNERWSGQSDARKSRASNASPAVKTPAVLTRPLTTRSIASTTRGALNA